MPDSIQVKRGPSKNKDRARLKQGEIGYLYDTKTFMVGTGEDHEPVCFINNDDLNVLLQTLENKLNKKIALLGGDSLVDPKKPYRLQRLWQRKVNDSPIFSMPIVTKFTQNGRLVIAYQSWDWRAFVVDFHTGEEMFYCWFGRELYGRGQAADVNNDGLTEFFFASHAGEIKCFNENSEMLWEQNDEYTRQGKGHIDNYANNVITDNSKSWAKGTFVKNPDKPSKNPEVRVTGANGQKQSTRVKDTDGTFLTLEDEITIELDEDSTYIIYAYYDSDKMFQHAGQLVEENGKWYLYTCGFDACCRKIDAVTGEVIWVYATKDQIEAFPLIDDLDGDGHLECYFTSVDWGVYSVNAEDGSLIWHTETENGNDAFLNTIDMSDGSRCLVVSSRDSRVYLFNTDGTIRNKTTLTNFDIDSRAVVGDFNNDGKNEFIFGGDGGYVYCCDEDCNTLWRHHIGTYMNASAIKADVNYDGKDEVLISDMNGTITVFNPETGDIIGEIFFKGSVEGTPAIGDFDDDGQIELVVTTMDGYIELLRFLRED